MEAVASLLPVLMCLVATNAHAGLGTVEMDPLVLVRHNSAFRKSFGFHRWESVRQFIRGLRLSAGFSCFVNQNLCVKHFEALTP